MNSCQAAVDVSGHPRALAAPLFVCIEITDRCDEACPTCYASPRDAACSQDMPDQQFQDLLSELNELHPAKVTFTGGEPGRKRERLFAAAAYLQDAANGRRLGMMTNGRDFRPQDGGALNHFFHWININLTPSLAESDLHAADSAGAVEAARRMIDRIPIVPLLDTGMVAVEYSILADARTLDVLQACAIAAKDRGAKKLNVLNPLSAPGHEQAALLTSEQRSRLIEAIAASNVKFPTRLIDSMRHAKRLARMHIPNAELYITASGGLAASPFIAAPAPCPSYIPGELRRIWCKRLAQIWPENAESSSPWAPISSTSGSRHAQGRIDAALAGHVHAGLFLRREGPDSYLCLNQDSGAIAFINQAGADLFGLTDERNDADHGVTASVADAAQRDSDKQAFIRKLEAFGVLRRKDEG